MLTAVITLTVFGAFAGFGLAVASKKFAVEKDERVLRVLESLPGVNCGACGYPGCAGMSEAIVSGKATPDGCPVCSQDMKEQIGHIMGIEVKAGAKEVPLLLCGGGEDCAMRTAEYDGPQNCKVIALASGGGKVCMYGCLGGGSCRDICPADAILMNENGLPVVDSVKCISCGLCTKECPRKLLKMWPVDKTVAVACSSKDKGGDVRKACSKGCIGCKMCEKACAFDAIKVNNFLASIDFEKCTVCKACVEKCPTKAIVSI